MCNCVIVWSVRLIWLHWYCLTASYSLYSYTVHKHIVTQDCSHSAVIKTQFTEMLKLNLISMFVYKCLEMLCWVFIQINFIQYTFCCRILWGDSLASVRSHLSDHFTPDVAAPRHPVWSFPARLLRLLHRYFTPVMCDTGCFDSIRCQYWHFVTSSSWSSTFSDLWFYSWLAPSDHHHSTVERNT